MASTPAAVAPVDCLAFTAIRSFQFCLSRRIFDTHAAIIFAHGVIMAAEDDWLKREKELLDAIDLHVSRYKRLSRRSRNAERSLSLIALICTSVLPVTVVSTAANLTAFGIPTSVVAGVSVALTIVVSIVEGLRRYLSANRVWASSTVARVTLDRVRGAYLDSQIGLTVGSPEWQANYRNFRSEMENAVTGEMTQFFDTLLKSSIEQKKVPTEA
jgi:hypothetical protein